MRILPDSNIFIEFWENKRGRTSEIETVFDNNDIVVCGAVRAELLHGAVSEKHLRSMTVMLDAFDEANLEASDWQTLGENLYKLRTHGVTVPFADVIIASVAIKYDSSVAVPLA